MRFVFFLQTSNLHPNKNIYKSEKLKHEPILKKPGDFTVAEGHGHPLVVINSF